MSRTRKVYLAALSLVLVLLLSIPLHSQTSSTFLDIYWRMAQIVVNSTPGSDDGYMWLTLPQAQKTIYLRGVLAGFYYSTPAVVAHAGILYCPAQADQTTIDAVVDFSNREVTGSLNRQIGRLSWVQLALGVDRFYNDAQNLRHPVLDAVIWLALNR